jgi:hypothetical protein
MIPSELCCRLHEMFAWFGSLWNPAPLDTAAEQSAAVWLQSGMQASLPPVQQLPARSSIFFVPVSNRAALRPRRATPLRTAGSATSENKQFCVGPPATDNTDIAPDRRLL